MGNDEKKLLSFEEISSLPYVEVSVLFLNGQISSEVFKQYSQEIGQYEQTSKQESQESLIFDDEIININDVVVSNALKDEINGTLERIDDELSLLKNDDSEELSHIVDMLKAEDAIVAITVDEMTKKVDNLKNIHALITSYKRVYKRNNDSHQVNFRSYLLTLKDKYGDSFIIYMSPEEEQKYVSLYAKSFNSREEDVALSIKYSKEIIRQNQTISMDESMEDAIGESVTILQSLVNSVNSNMELGMETEFKELFKELSDLSNTSELSDSEKEQKYLQILGLRNRIKQFKNKVLFIDLDKSISKPNTNGL